MLKSESTFTELKLMAKALVQICKQENQLNSFYSFKGLPELLVKLI